MAARAHGHRRILARHMAAKEGVMNHLAIVLLLLAHGCGGTNAADPTPTSVPASRATPAPEPTPPASVSPPPTANPQPAPNAIEPATAGPRIVPPSVARGVDFIGEAKALYRVAGCAEGDLPEALARDAKFAPVVDKHCKAIAPHVAKFRKIYFEDAKTWLAAHVPNNIPPTVVYPFGGGDLLSALAVFPNAAEYTTISLELAGDPRKLAELTPAKLDGELAKFRNEVSWLIQFGSNTSVNLSAQQRSALPGQVTSFLLALAIGGYEPVAMRFFRLEAGGTLVYYDQAEIDADTKNTKSLSERWNKPAFAAAFRNVELSFRKRGGGPLQVHRHIAWNLGNQELAKEGALLAHLQAKGKVTMIVKGASYLLWQDDFTTIRKYILDHLSFMLSDSTAIPPMWATPAGMVLEPWGKYVKPGLPHAVGHKADLDMRALWKAPAGPAPFRFGYIDSNNNHHLLITRPK
jgi:hypothetical protein